jgi:hypothetical protein
MQKMRDELPELYRELCRLQEVLTKHNNLRREEVAKSGPNSPATLRELAKQRKTLARSYHDMLSIYKACEGPAWRQQVKASIYQNWLRGQPDRVHVAVQQLVPGIS